MGHRFGIALVEDRSLEALRAERAGKGWRRSLRVAIGFFVALLSGIAALYLIR
jgi:hypothetical protein